MDLGWLARRPSIRLARAVKRRADGDDVGAQADGLTYQAFVALFPLLLLAISIAGFLMAGSDPGRWASRFARAIPGLEELAGGAARAIVRNREGAGILGLAGLAWRGVALVEAAGLAMGRVFRVPKYGGRLRRKAWAVGSLVSLGTLALTGAAASAWAATFEGPGAAAGGILLALALDGLLFLLAYRVLVQRRGPAYAHLWKGALAGATAWGALKLVGAMVASWSATSATGIYGPFAAIIAVLFVLRLGATIFLYGAELNATLIERAAKDGEPPATPAERALTRSA